MACREQSAAQEPRRELQHLATIVAQLFVAHSSRFWCVVARLHRKRLGQDASYSCIYSPRRFRLAHEKGAAGVHSGRGELGGIMGIECWPVFRLRCLEILQRSYGCGPSPGNMKLSGGGALKGCRFCCRLSLAQSLDDVWWWWWDAGWWVAFTREPARSEKSTLRQALDKVAPG